MPISLRELIRRRLAGQFLTGPKPTTPVDVVRALGAVQAQDYPAAKWAIGQRSLAATDSSVERELDSAAVVRTHVLRPTWHVVAAADIRWMLELTAPRIRAAMASHDRALELDDKVHRRARAILVRALRDAAYTTRGELGAALERGGIPIGSGQRLAHIMMRAELDAVVCSGPRRGKHFTYALFDERVVATPRLARDEALHELARRYFTTRGPATVHDFAWWSGLTIADANRGVQSMGELLTRATFEGTPMWFVYRALPRSSTTAHLLPNYDEYFIGHKDRSAIGRRLGSAASVIGGNALITPVVVLNGQLAGRWRRVAEKGDIGVALDLPTSVTAAERRRIDDVVRRMRGFLSGVLP